MKRLVHRMMLLCIGILMLSGCKEEMTTTERVYDVYKTENKNVDEVAEEKENKQDVGNLLPEEQVEDDSEGLSLEGEYISSGNETTEEELYNLREETQKKMEQLEIEIDIKDVIEGIDEIHPDNAFHNDKGWYLLSYPICYDSINECLYYVQYKGDSCIYKWKNGVSELFLDMKASDLTVWDHYLYFVNAASMYDIEGGSVMQYDLNSQELKCIYEGNAYNFYVDRNGICFAINDVVQDGKMYTKNVRIEHDTQEITEDNESRRFQYEEIKLALDRNRREVVFTNEITGQEKILPIREYYDEYRIQDNYLTIRENVFLFILNLQTGEEIIIDARDCDIPYSETIRVNDYMICGDILYIATSHSGAILRVDLTSGDKCEVYSKLYDAGIYELYVGGDRLYCYYETDNKYVHFAEIVFEENKFEFMDIASYMSQYQ